MLVVEEEVLVQKTKLSILLLSLFWVGYVLIGGPASQFIAPCLVWLIPLSLRWGIEGGTLLGLWAGLIASCCFGVHLSTTCILYGLTGLILGFVGEYVVSSFPLRALVLFCVMPVFYGLYAQVFFTLKLNYLGLSWQEFWLIYCCSLLAEEFNAYYTQDWHTPEKVLKYRV